MTPVPESRFWLYSLILSGVYFKMGVLLPFVIGSFCLINSTFYLIVISLGAAAQVKTEAYNKKTDAKPANYGYMTYTLYEPLMLGSFNAIGAYIAEYFNLEGPARFLVTWAVCHSVVMPMVVLGGFYKFTKLSEWFSYFGKQVLLYGFVINVLCQGIEYLVVKEFQNERKLV
ncbi:hypothetical protein BDR26DRAFT_858082 [Obelidium mucronatum]|nr:hypothetical protein BDR26DRAFT_858082 [Obelidium mucronatum]